MDSRSELLSSIARSGRGGRGVDGSLPPVCVRIEGIFAAVDVMACLRLDRCALRASTHSLAASRDTIDLCSRDVPSS